MHTYPKAPVSLFDDQSIHFYPLPPPRHYFGHLRYSRHGYQSQATLPRKLHNINNFVSPHFKRTHHELPITNFPNLSRTKNPKMANVFATVLLTPNPGKMVAVSLFATCFPSIQSPQNSKRSPNESLTTQVQERLLTVAGQVEQSHPGVLQYHLFEEVGREGWAVKEDRKIIVHIRCKSTPIFVKTYMLCIYPHI